MARKRSAARIEEEVPVTALRIHRHQDDRDPRAPLPDGNAAVPETGTARRIEDETSQDLFSKYARNLIATRGNVEQALAATYEISVDEAMRNMVALHERVRAASRANTNATDMFERHDLQFEVRLASLRDMLFSDKEAFRLKAIEMSNEMDATTKAKRIGTSWETFVSQARKRAAAPSIPAKKAS